LLRVATFQIFLYNPPFFLFCLRFGKSFIKLRFYKLFVRFDVKNAFKLCMMTLFRRNNQLFLSVGLSIRFFNSIC